MILSPWTRWSSKLWSAENFARLGDFAADALGAQIILTGSTNDRPGNDVILTLMKRRAVNLAGMMGLKETACLFARCSCVVTPDSGPLHLACAVEVPVISLFGPTAPWRTGPYPPSRGTVVRKELPCSPCFKRTCAENVCMKRITVEEVAELLALKVKELN